MNISNIVKGHINEVLKLNQNISKNRLAICYKCPLFSPQFGGVCNSKLWINPETEDISIKQKDGYKRGCGCRLDAKTTLINAHCLINKW